MKLLRLWLPVLLLLALAASLAYGQAPDRTVTVNIDEQGVASVTISVNLNEGIHELPLPVPPLLPTILVLSDGTAVPAVYDDGRLLVVLDKGGRVEVSYVANVSILGGIFQLDIVTEELVELRVPPSVILVGWPTNRVVSAGMERGTLILDLRGPATIRYTVRGPTTATPTQEQPALTTQFAFPWYLGVVIVAVVAGSLYYILYLYRRKSYKADILALLGDVDIAIVRALESKGGRAPQSELQSELNVPKSTLWKHVRKLERLGIVRVEKVGGQNVVVLVKKVKGSS